ncbi:hypothetical protein BGZ65_011095, partial [Modicella reniformis]
LLQRYVVRILFMVPVYAISSLVALESLEHAFYIDALRDIYEAFVLYCFFNLLFHFLGGERALLIMLHGRPYTKQIWPFNWFHKDVGDPIAFLSFKRGILQYVYVKPVLAVMTAILKFKGIPTSKFLCIKAIVFFTFWQGVVISLLISRNILRDATPETAVIIQDSLICLEVFVVAIGHWHAFSHKDYIETGLNSARMAFGYAFNDVIGIKDVIQDSRSTLEGTWFTYGAFKPCEGMATAGKSRFNRMMAGLRYTDGGASKYWLPEVNNTNINTNNRIHSNRGTLNSSNNTIVISIPEQQQHSLSDVQENSNSSGQREGLGHSYDDLDNDTEYLYKAAKLEEYVEYGYPVVPVNKTANNLYRSEVASYRQIRGWKEKGSQQRPNENTPLLAYRAVTPEDTRSYPNGENRKSLRWSSWCWATTLFQDDKDKEPQSSRVGCVNGYVPELKDKMSLHVPAWMLIEEVQEQHSTSVPASYFQ